MKYTVRALAVILLLVMLGSSLVSCVSLKPTEQDMKVVGTIGDYEVYYDELRYFTMNFIRQMKSTYSEEDLKTPAIKAKYEKELQDNVISAILLNYAVLTACDFYKVDHEHEAIMEKANEDVDLYIESFGGKREYKKALEENYMTDRFFRFYQRLEYARSELKYVLADDLGIIPGTDEELKEFMLSDEFICTRHICLLKDGETDIDTLKQKMQMILDKLDEGADFETLIGTYSEDFQDTGRGYYFTRGEMVEVYEEAAFDLSVGEHSDIIETDVGFFIIMRFSKDKGYMLGEEKADGTIPTNNYANFVYQIQYALTEQEIQEFKDTLSFVFSDYGKSLVLSEME